MGKTLYLGKLAFHLGRIQGKLMFVSPKSGISYKQIFWRLLVLQERTESQRLADKQ